MFAPGFAPSWFSSQVTLGVTCVPSDEHCLRGCGVCGLFSLKWALLVITWVWLGAGATPVGDLPLQNRVLSLVLVLGVKSVCHTVITGGFGAKGT